MTNLAALCWLTTLARVHRHARGACRRAPAAPQRSARLREVSRAPSRHALAVATETHADEASWNE